MTMSLGVTVAPADQPTIDGTLTAGPTPRQVWDIAARGLALLAIVGLVPVLLVIALSVKVTSPGPVLFRQTRVGLAGRTFTLWKFRTMRLDAEDVLPLIAGLNEHDGLLFKVRRDPRVTAIGRWLRRFSLDELPQLWNVVRGEMALVGPRPPLPREVVQYDHVAARRLTVKPGLTGLWQVSGRSELPWRESLRLDLHYIENWSPRLELSILLRTISAVLTGRGAW